MSASDLSQNLRHALTRFRNGFCVLLALTFGLLAWQHYGMERSIDIDGANAVRVEVGSDRELGGASTARLDHDGAALRMHCDLVKQAQWPYCRLRVYFGSDLKGVDLTRFERISLDLAYEGPGSHQARLYLINFEEGLSRPGDFSSNRVDELELFTVPERGSISIPVAAFYTAPWWKADRKISLEQTGVRYDNVLSIDILNAGNATPGPYTMTLKALHLQGKWISQTHLLLWLVAVWIVWPLLAALSLHGELATSKVQLKRMQALNRALELEARELAGQAHADPLTHVLNREGLRAFLMQQGDAKAGPMSVIFTDIDHFKSVNDSHGHAVGDAVLRHFAQVLQATVRSTDRVVRWGGEEFLIVCTNTDERKAAVLAEKLRDTMHLQIWPAGLQVRASFGVAEHLEAEDIGELIRRADAQLYAAKRAGRDRVHVHGKSAPSRQHTAPPAITQH